MRRFVTLAITIGMLAGPTAAFAEYATPADLLSVVQSEMKPRNFSVTAKGRIDQTWYAVWAKGAAENMKPDLSEGKMTMSMTVDVVHGGFKIRAKGQAILKDGSVFLKLDSVDGSYADMFMTFKTMFGQKLWLEVPMDPSMMEMHSTMTGMSMTDNANEMFSMTQTKFGAGHTYVLTMRPEYAQQFSDLMRDITGATNTGVSDDFFPFLDLAYDSADFTLRVDTNAQDQFQLSSFDMHWKAGNAELTMTGKSQRQTAPVSVETPKNAWTMEQLEKHYNQIMGISDDSESEATQGSEWEIRADDEAMTDEDAGFDAVDNDEWWEPVTDGTTQYYSDECWNPELAPLKKLSMQRTGECPVEDINNRTSRR